jgi:hypothetical protein
MTSGPYSNADEQAPGVGTGCPEKRSGLCKLPFSRTSCALRHGEVLRQLVEGDSSAGAPDVIAMSWMRSGLASALNSRATLSASNSPGVPKVLVAGAAIASLFQNLSDSRLSRNCEFVSDTTNGLNPLRLGLITFQPAT